jgi:beta-lactamase superfamily II metal-dependent hydrolase
MGIETAPAHHPEEVDAAARPHALAVLGVLVLVTAMRAAAASTGGLTVRFVTVDEGEATVFRGPCGELGVLDVPAGGEHQVLAALDSFGSRHLRWLAVSHYHDDHVGSVVALAGAPGVHVDAVYDRGPSGAPKSSFYGSYRDWLHASHVPHHALTTGAAFSLCTGIARVTFDVVSAGVGGRAAGGLVVPSENDKSLCLKITYRRFSMASCGDIDGFDVGSRRDVESVVARKIGHVDLVQANHQGSRYSSNWTYVRTLAPSATVISIGRRSYRHLSLAVVRRWRTLGDVFETGARNGPRDGDVIATTNGTSLLRVRTTHSRKLRAYRLRPRGPLEVRR